VSALGSGDQQVADAVGVDVPDAHDVEAEVLARGRARDRPQDIARSGEQLHAARERSAGAGR